MFDQRVVRRTRLKPGRAHDYEILHARLPEIVYDQLALAGVVSWEIWRDGLTLIHIIDTRGTYDDMLNLLAERGTIDEEWDDRVAQLLEDPGSGSVPLEFVWKMDAHGQLSQR